MKEPNQMILVCFTSSFPFGMSETYFENELNYLSKIYKEVHIYPIYNPYGKKIRSVPDNVHIHSPLLKQGVSRILDGFRNFSFNKELFKDFWEAKVYKNKSRFKKWLNALFLLQNGLQIVKELPDNESAVLYSYWAEIPFFVSPHFNKYIKIVRMHGGDFYEERNFGYLPLRNIIYKNASLLLPISFDINKILLEKYSINKEKIFLSYLGVENDTLFRTIKRNCKINFVSCSNVYPLKRIEKIFEFVNSFPDNIKVKWMHIGGGPSFESIQELVQNKRNSNVEIVLLGHKTQSELKKIYSENYFDWFINMSTHEGLPVSIMEAFSFGIPAIATDVGGTSEIVNITNGILINKYIDGHHIFELSERLLNMEAQVYSQLRIHAYLTWMLKFNAQKNYNLLCEKLKTL